MFGTSLHMNYYKRANTPKPAERIQWVFDHCELLRRMNCCTNYCDRLRRHPLRNPPLLWTPKYSHLLANTLSYLSELPDLQPYCRANATAPSLVEVRQSLASTVSLCRCVTSQRHGIFVPVAMQMSLPLFTYLLYKPA